MQNEQEASKLYTALLSCSYKLYFHTFLHVADLKDRSRHQVLFLLFKVYVMMDLDSPLCSKLMGTTCLEEITIFIVCEFYYD